MIKNAKKNKDIPIEFTIGTEKESLWTQVKKETESQIESLKKALIVQEGILELSIKKIDEEKFK